VGGWEREEGKVELGHAVRWAKLGHTGEIGWRPARKNKKKGGRKRGGPVEVWAERPGRGARPRELLGRELGKEAGLKKEKERGREEGFGFCFFNFMIFKTSHKQEKGHATKI
jgi:hypothetical protein